jgi:hypothetical protein
MVYSARLESLKVYPCNIRFDFDKVVSCRPYCESIFDDGKDTSIFLSRIFNYNVVDATIHYSDTGFNDSISFNGNGFLYSPCICSHCAGWIVGCASIVQGNLDYL